MASLLALSRAGSDEAKKFFGRRYLAQAGALVFGFVSAYVHQPEVVVYTLVVAAFLLELLAWLLSYRAKKAQDISETARRRAMLVDGLGETYENADIVDIRSKLSHLEKEAAVFEDSKYYNSTRQPGNVRLKDHLQESSFWSKHLYRYSSQRSFIWVVVVLSSVVLVGFTTLPTINGDQSLLVAKGLVIVLGFIVGIDEIGKALTWRAAAEKLEVVDRRLENINPDNLEPLLAVFGDYSVATSSALPIPNSVYNSKKNLLEGLWKERQSD